MEKEHKRVFAFVGDVYLRERAAKKLMSFDAPTSCRNPNGLLSTSPRDCQRRSC
jgi:hypothetical protein